MHTMPRNRDHKANKALYFIRCPTVTTCLRFRVEHIGFGIKGLEFRVQDSRLRVQVFKGLRVQGAYKNPSFKFIIKNNGSTNDSHSIRTNKSCSNPQIPRLD